MDWQRVTQAWSSSHKTPAHWRCSCFTETVVFYILLCVLHMYSTLISFVLLPSLETFCLQAVHVCLRPWAYTKSLLKSMSCKLVIGISPNLQLPCTWVQRWIDFEVKRSEVKVARRWHAGSIFPPISGMHGYTLIKLIRITYQQVQSTLMTALRL